MAEVSGSFSDFLRIYCIFFWCVYASKESNDPVKQLFDRLLVDTGLTYTYHENPPNFEYAFESFDLVSVVLSLVGCCLLLLMCYWYNWYIPFQLRSPFLHLHPSYHLNFDPIDYQRIFHQTIIFKAFETIIKPHEPGDLDNERSGPHNRVRSPKHRQRRRDYVRVE